ncbi:hypothetical protein ACWGTI_19400 [Mesorhizobium sp. ArgA1]
MKMIGRDFEPPIFTGSGRIVIKSFTGIEYRMYATPLEGGDAFRRLVQMEKDPYDATSRFRLIATDIQGTEWAAGWTHPQLGETKSGVWELFGDLHSLLTGASGPWVSDESGVELVFQPELRLPVDTPVVTVSTLEGVEIERGWRLAKRTVKVLDSEIEFFRTKRGGSLWITARSSKALPHPYTENWLGEPLRILLGQLSYPRLVARNFGGGRAQVSLRPSPRQFRDSALASLVGGNPLEAKPDFWTLYGKLLEFIANARDESGHPNFEAHLLTRLYEEIIQATQGSRWVLCLTLAGVAEGLTKLLMGPTPLKADYPEEDLESIRAHVAAWKGNAELKSRLLSAIRNAGVRTVGKFLRDLQQTGALTAANVGAWSDLRNHVMHGNLVSPYSTREEDQSIVDLADLVHRLTRAIVGIDAGQPTTIDSSPPHEGKS